MIVCYHALRADSRLARRILAGRNPPVRAYPRRVGQTPETAWEACVGDQDGYLLVRWEWLGGVDTYGCWLLTNPQLV